MKIQQCFLELQLKMSGMFFETHCSSHSKISTAGLSQNYLVGDKFSASMVHGTMGARRRGHGGGTCPLEMMKSVFCCKCRLKPQ